MEVLQQAEILSRAGSVPIGKKLAFLEQDWAKRRR